MALYKFGGAYSFGDSGRSSLINQKNDTPGPGAYALTPNQKNKGSTFSKFPKM